MDIADFLIDRWADEGQHAHNTMDWLDGEKWTAILPQQEWLARKPDAPLSVRRFVTQQSPRRVIDDITAKARLLQLHGGDRRPEPMFCAHCEHDAPCPTLRLLALPYAGHPDYRPEWSPEP